MKNESLENQIELIDKTIKPSTFTISKEDWAFVEETLKLNELTTKEELFNIRNSVVKYYRDKITEAKNSPYGHYHYEQVTKFIAFTSAITHCIDVRLVELGFME